MTKDEIPAIFNPKRVRAPSVVVTGESPNNSLPGITTIPGNQNQSQLFHSDSVGSSQNDGETTACIQSANQHFSGTNDRDTHNDMTLNLTPPQVNVHRFQKCHDSCCSELARKVIYF